MASWLTSWLTQWLQGDEPKSSISADDVSLVFTKCVNEPIITLLVFVQRTQTKRSCDLSKCNFVNLFRDKPYLSLWKCTKLTFKVSMLTIDFEMWVYAVSLNISWSDLAGKSAVRKTPAVVNVYSIWSILLTSHVDGQQKAFFHFSHSGCMISQKKRKEKEKKSSLINRCCSLWQVTQTECDNLQNVSVGSTEHSMETVSNLFLPLLLHLWSGHKCTKRRNKMSSPRAQQAEKRCYGGETTWLHERGWRSLLMTFLSWRR